MTEVSSHSFRSLAIWLSAICVACILIPLVNFPAPPVVSGHPWRVELAGSILLCTFLLAARLRSGRSFASLFGIADPAIRRIFLFLLMFTAWSGLSFFWAGSTGSVLHHTLLWGTYLTFFLLAFRLLATEKNLHVILVAFALASAVLTVSCLSDYLGISQYSTPETVVRIRYAKYAELLLTLAPLLWAACLYARSVRRTVPLLLAGSAAWLTTMLSLSKGAFLSGLAGFAIFFIGSLLFSARAYRSRVLILAGIWLLLTVSVQVIAPAVISVPSTTGYISGAAEPNRETSKVRLYIWSVSRDMISLHWLAGVGGDNFGTEFNLVRPEHEKRISTSDRDVAEYYMVERAHNEFLQIFAELGAVGILLFGAALLAFAIYAARSFIFNNWSFSPMLWGSLAGLAGFLVSSQVSSFSFRVMQNGLVFLVVAAVGLYELSKIRRPRSEKRADLRPTFARNLSFSAACILSILLVIYSAARGLSYTYQYQASQVVDAPEKERSYERAEFFDPSNGAAFFSHGQWLAREGDHANAAMLFRKAIDLGLGVTTSYSLMARSQILSGSPDRAEQSLEEAVSIFPRSIFARVRYSVLLEERSKPEKAREQMMAARAMDEREANGWYYLIKEGSTAAIYKANADPAIAKPAELRPENAVFEFLKS